MKEPRVGVGVFVCKDGQFLVGHRQGSHGAGSWALPGGHLEYGESFEETAVREVFEETGVKIANVAFAAVTNDIFHEENKHYVTIWVTSELTEGEPQILEPHKCLEWRWVDLDSVPTPWFEGWNQLFKSEFVDDIRQTVAATK